MLTALTTKKIAKAIINYVCRDCRKKNNVVFAKVSKETKDELAKSFKS